MSSHNDSFAASGTSPTENGPDFRCENHGSLFCFFPSVNPLNPGPKNTFRQMPNGLATPCH